MMMEQIRFFGFDRCLKIHCAIFINQFFLFILTFKLLSLTKMRFLGTVNHNIFIRFQIQLINKSDKQNNPFQMIIMFTE